MEVFDVVVVGGGICGLATGALLAEEGKKVLLLEKEKMLGGRGFATTYRGHVIDNGAHGLVSLGYLEKVFKKVGKIFPKDNYINTTEIYFKGAWRPLMEILPRSELKKILSEIADADWTDIGKTNDISLLDWVSRRTNNEGIHQFMYYMGWTWFVGNKYEAISAGETLSCLKYILELPGGFHDSIAFPKGGYAALYNPLADALRENGGEIRTETLVSNIVIRNGIVRGVEVLTKERTNPAQLPETDMIEAPIVVSTLPVWDLFNIVSEDQFPSWYVAWFQGLLYLYRDCRVEGAFV